MRSSLVVAGAMIALTGVGLFAALDGTAWLAFTAGGVVVMACGYVLEEAVGERVEAPPGFHFCPFCSTPVAEGSERCGHCNGLQERGEKAAPSQSG